MTFTNRLKSQGGQALLIVVLIMVVALTVGLSIATRSVVNVKNTTNQANSQKALAAAEAGVEQALKNDTAPGAPAIVGTFNTTGTTNATSYSTTVSTQNTTQNFLINGGDLVSKDDAIDVWVTTYSSDPATAFSTSWSGSEFDIFWGNDKNNPCNNAALEVAIIYGTKAAPSLKRVTIDPCSARRAVNHFGTATSTSQATTNIGGQTLQYRATLTSGSGVLPPNVLLIRINPIYMGTAIGVFGTPTLPAQGRIITSQGTANNSTTRKITVYEGYPEVPAEFFPYNLFQP